MFIISRSSHYHRQHASIIPVTKIIWSCHFAARYPIHGLHQPFLMMQRAFFSILIFIIMTSFSYGIYSIFMYIISIFIAVNSIFFLGGTLIPIFSESSSLLVIPKLQVYGERILGLLTVVEQLLGTCTCNINYPDILWLPLTTVNNQKVSVLWTSLSRYL